MFQRSWNRVTHGFTFSSETSRDFKLFPTTRSSSSSSTILLRKEKQENPIKITINGRRRRFAAEEMCQHACVICSLMPFPTIQLIFFIDTLVSLGALLDDWNDANSRLSVPSVGPRQIDFKCHRTKTSFDLIGVDSAGQCTQQRMQMTLIAASFGKSNESI